jgi:hypothetical protein
MLGESFRNPIPSREEETTDATAQTLRSLARICLVCGKAPETHQYARIGCAFEKSKIAEMFKIIRAREWSKMSSLREFDPMKNAILAFAVKGPHDGGFLMVIKNPFELYEADELYMVEVLSVQEMIELTAHLSENAWKPL